MSLINLAFWWTARRVLGLVTFIGVLLVSVFNFFVWAFLRMIIAPFLFWEEYPEGASPKEKMKCLMVTLKERKEFASAWADTICNPFYRWVGMLLLRPTLYLFVQHISAKLRAYPFEKEVSPWTFSFPFICQEKAVRTVFMEECERAFPDFIVRTSGKNDDLFHLKWKSGKSLHHGDTLPPALRATVM